MTPSEMEEQIKNLNQWAGEVAQYLPLLATKEELKAGLEDTKRYTENLILMTRREIRQVDEKVTSMALDVRKIAEQVAILSRRARRSR